MTETRKRPVKLSKLYWLEYVFGGKWTYDHKRTWTCSDGRKVEKVFVTGRRDSYLMTNLDGTTQTIDLD